MTSQMRSLGVLGVQIDHVDLMRFDVDRLRDLLAEHGVIVMSDQPVNDDTFLAFLRRFGKLAFTAGEQPLGTHPDLNLISNVGRTTTPQSSFHVDTSYVDRPPAYTALRAVVIPAHGGETVFSNQYRAFDTLPLAVRERLDGRRIRHVATGVQLADADQQEAEHPVFRPHPRSGRTALYLSAPQRCVSISGMDIDESRRAVTMLLEHSTREDNTIRHTWTPGDVVMWDNSCVLHKADHSGVVGDRVMHRGMVAEYGQ